MGFNKSQSQSSANPSTTSTEISNAYNTTLTQSLGQQALGLILGNESHLSLGSATYKYNSENVYTTLSATLGAGSPLEGGSSVAPSTSSGESFSQWLPYILVGVAILFLFRMLK